MELSCLLVVYDFDKKNVIHKKKYKRISKWEEYYFLC